MRSPVARAKQADARDAATPLGRALPPVANATHSAPYLFILSVMCHELAHIEQMNHSRDFQKVNAEIKQELRELRRAGYFGDGFWSAGRSQSLPFPDHV